MISSSSCEEEDGGGGELCNQLRGHPAGPAGLKEVEVLLAKVF